MIEAAEHEFRLDRKREDGASEREHLESAKRQIAKLPGWKGKPASAVVPDGAAVPDALLYLWAWFHEHSQGLAQNGMGYPAVTWEGLAAWCGLTGILLEPWEAQAMVHLGALRAGIEGEKSQAEMKRRQGGA